MICTKMLGKSENLKFELEEKVKHQGQTDFHIRFKKGSYNCSLKKKKKISILLQAMFFQGF